MRAKILNASAGSGKTYQLAYKYVHDVIEQPTLYRHILAVTFTNKATEEMKSRILSEIHTLASGGESSYLTNLCKELSLDAQTVRKRAKEVRSKILHDYSRFTVLTIDTFFQRILRAFIKELGIDLNYNVEIETSSVLAQSAESLIEQITVDRDLQQWLTAFVQERIDEGKKWDIRDGILSLGSEIFKEKNKDALSVARSKEELHEIVDKATLQSNTSKEQLLSLAQKAVSIIANAGCSPTNFTGKSRSFINYFYVLADGELKPYTKTVDNMRSTTDGWCPKGSPAEPLVPTLQPLLAEVCDLYDRSIRLWNTCDLLRENYRSFALLADLYGRVKQLCDDQNLMLLSETKYILSAFIDHNDAPFIYEKVGNRFDRFMIDEFQDTSSKEWENFLPLLKNAMSQADDNTNAVLIVGDIKQSIYRWRGGDWNILHEGAEKALGKENTKVFPLTENYRSLPVLVDFNNRIITRVVNSDNETLNAALATAYAQGDLTAENYAALQDTLFKAYKDHDQIPKRKAENPGYVSIATFAQKPPVVETICNLIDRGFRPCDIMILVRTANEGADVAADLLEFKRTNEEEQYRFDVMTREALIIGNAPVSSFVAASLRLALNPDDSMNRALYNHYLGRPFDASLAEEERLFFRSIRLLSPEEAFERILIRHELQDDKSLTAYLQAIHEQIIAFCANKIADIQLFLQWWDEQGCNKSLSVEQSVSSVEITTIHKAKGLEKHAVIIPYCSWRLDPKSAGNTDNFVWAESHGTAADEIGRFPVKYKKNMAESGFSSEYYREKVYAHVDNINLLYVALTRAAESLHIFIPQGTRAANVGDLLLQNIETREDKALLGDGDEGRYTETEDSRHFEFGDFAGPVAGKEKEATREHITLENYPTARADLRLRLPSQRYFEQEDEVVLAPRNFGILMHKAFELAANREEIDAAVENMHATGNLSTDEMSMLRQMIDKALSDPNASEWFSDKWSVIRNENEIIIPGSKTTRRPDRVMIAGNEAVVVDYKFGERDAERYRRQIREYAHLLQQMGYQKVFGFLWYVKLGSIEEVVTNE